MLLSLVSVALAFLTVTTTAAPTTTGTIDKRSISQSLLNDFVLYTKYSSAAYQFVCPIPVGNKLVLQFSDGGTSTQGFIARDDNRHEIVVSFRGSIQPQDFLTDIDFLLVPFSTQGLSSSAANGVSAHQGFLKAYNSVASLVVKTVADQLKQHPTYTLISTGHSLGGAIASIGAVSLAANFPGKPLKLYTFGQPRTGNAAYAALVENQVGVDNIFRAVHTYDGVPTILPEAIGYRHHATEYWNFQDPALPSTVKRCQGGEDPTCSDSIPSTGINLAHVSYFGQEMALNPLLCL